jgi:hypothetical protein
MEDSYEEQMKVLNDKASCIIEDKSCHEVLKPLSNFTEQAYDCLVSSYIRELHSTISLLWTDETAHSSYLPRPLGAAKSYGQCVPTTHILFDLLLRKFPKHRFSIASGIVLVSSNLDSAMFKIAIDAHTWLSWQPTETTSLKDIVIIDPTADQIPYADLFPCEIQTNEELRRRGVIYQSPRIFNSLEAFENQFAIREPEVRSRIRLLRERFDSVSFYKFSNQVKTS